MATLIPEFLPAAATSGEKSLARVLRKLPEDWTVYHEPRVRGLRPDFVILAPQLGLLVLEVKDWKFASIRSFDQEMMEMQSGGSAGRRVKNPLRQVDDYWRAVKDACRENLFGQVLLAKEGPWKGNLCFPVGALTVFTGISGREVAGSPLRAAWEAIFTPDVAILSEERKRWETMEEAELVEVFRPRFRPFGMKERFTAQQIDVLRWVLFPESRLDVILGKSAADAAQAMEVLDARQEQHARSLGSGHRILFGVAGSGKTVLLLARARWIAHEFPDRRTLLLCYNKVLAAWLAERIRDCPSVTVLHFDGWAKGMKLARKRGTEEDNAVFGARLLEDLRKQGDAARVFDTVLIDEAQDFEPSWFQCAMAAMKDPADGDLVIVADGSQRLYRRTGLSWKALGIKAAGRTISARYDLDKNYRNTPQIAELAFGYSSNEKNEDGITSVQVEPCTCRRHSRSKPVMVAAASPADQVSAALEIAGRWLRGIRNGQATEPIKPKDIGIFYPRLAQNQGLLEKLIAGLSTLAPVRWLSNPQDSRAWKSVNDDAIKVQTIHSAKGLQYKAVMVIWTDLLPKQGLDVEDERRLMYVAITRAENDLVLLGSGLKGFVSELREKCAVREFPFSRLMPESVA